MGKLENRLRETISDLQEKHNEIVELGEEKFRERDEYLAPLIGRLEEIDDEDIASIQNAGDYDTSLSGDLDDVAMNFEDTVVETENNEEEFSEEISRIIQEMKEAW